MYLARCRPFLTTMPFSRRDARQRLYVVTGVKGYLPSKALVNDRSIDAVSWHRQQGGRRDAMRCDAARDAVVARDARVRPALASSYLDTSCSRRYGRWRGRGIDDLRSLYDGTILSGSREHRVPDRQPHGMTVKDAPHRARLSTCVDVLRVCIAY